MPAKYPPGESAPPPLTKGPGHENLNDRLEYVYSMLLLPADPSVTITPGTATSPGRLRATATGGGSAAPATPPFTVQAAATKEQPARVRVFRGFLGGLLPAEMNLVDSALPDGTDHRCYLVLPGASGYVYGKVLVDAQTGFPAGANVYATGSAEEPDQSFVYFLIAYVTYDPKAGLGITQIGSGNQTLALAAAPDGTLQPIWSAA